MVGGLAVISDVPKTLVYRLSAYVNSRRKLIPEATIEKPPSAELRPDQKDSDSLPPYEVLDAIVEDYVEESRSAEQIARDHNVDLGLVQRVIRMVERSEYKRQQAAPGIKISAKAFGYGRRSPNRGQGGDLSVRVGTAALGCPAGEARSFLFGNDNCRGFCNNRTPVEFHTMTLMHRILLAAVLLPGLAVAQTKPAALAAHSAKSAAKPVAMPTAPVATVLPSEETVNSFLFQTLATIRPSRGR